MILLKVLTVKNVLSAPIGILIVGSNFKIPVVMVVMIRWYCAFILVILLFSLLNELIVVVLFMTLTTFIQLICWNVLCLMIGGIYKMHFKEINVKNRDYKCYFNYLIKAKNNRGKKYFNRLKNYKDLTILLLDLIVKN